MTSELLPCRECGGRRIVPDGIGLHAYPEDRPCPTCTDGTWASLTEQPPSDGLAVGLADAFEMGYSWHSMLFGQTLEDSRAVGRTLYSDTLEPIRRQIDAIIAELGFNSFEDSDKGICAAKSIILTALSRPDAATVERCAQVADEYGENRYGGSLSPENRIARCIAAAIRALRSGERKVKQPNYQALGLDDPEGRN